MDEEAPGPNSFATKSAGWRIAILSAGVIMNVIVAIVLLSIQGVIGAPVVVTEDNEGTLTNQLTYILEVVPASPAEEAGLQPLDRIARVGSTQKPSLPEVQRLLTEGAGGAVELEIERHGQHLTLQVTPRENPPSGQGALGVSLASTGLRQVPWWQAPWHGVVRSYEILREIIVQFSLIIGRLVRDGSAPQALTGPIGIAVYTNEVTNLGFSYVLEFGALISLNLALINILPIPALDGGRIVFVIFERIFGRRFPGKIEQISHTVGFAALIVLMLLITFKDIQRYF